MLISSKGLEKYFRELDLGEDDLASLGLHICHISVFDHWLSEEEASKNPLMSYSIAIDAGASEEYFHGEQKFLKLYASLSAAGVLCNRPGPLQVFETFNFELERIFINSLREKRSMDVYFKEACVRVIGRYDRTDLVIADSQMHLDALRLRAKKFGLFQLN